MQRHLSPDEQGAGSTPSPLGFEQTKVSVPPSFIKRVILNGRETPLGGVREDVIRATKGDHNFVATIDPKTPDTLNIHLASAELGGRRVPHSSFPELEKHKIIGTVSHKPDYIGFVFHAEISNEVKPFLLDSVIRLSRFFIENGFIPHYPLAPAMTYDFRNKLGYEGQAKTLMELAKEQLSLKYS